MEICQLFDENAQPIGKGAAKDDIYSHGLLHGAAHVWVWRKNGSQLEVLLQKRGPNMKTWPGRYDISAAGHIDQGETGLSAAIRETQEEIGLAVEPSALQLVGIERMNAVAPPSNIIENEFQWVYMLEVSMNTKFTKQASEVSSLLWQSFEEFEADVLNNEQTKKIC